jgi:hypothetical protein
MSHTRFVRAIGLAALGIVLMPLWSAGPIEASQIRPVNLEEMTQRADRIFEGRCVDVREEFDSRIGRYVSVVTFEIDDPVKGVMEDRVTIRLLSGATPPGGDRQPGLTRFTEGEAVLLFLYGESRLGLTSPVGFGQGKFNIVESKAGQRFAVNGFGNKNLLRDLSEDAEDLLEDRLFIARQKREIEPRVLREMVDRLVDQADGSPTLRSRGVERDGVVK